jgi:hypothetical protein
MPTSRDPSKDTKAYLTLMCNKTEVLRAAQQARERASVFAWIDAGITKVLEPHAAPAILANMAERVLAASPSRILIPGCWPMLPGAPSFFVDVWPQPESTPLEHYTLGVMWRFSGGFALVPAHLVTPFAETVAQACRDITESSDCLTWEVNVWACVERKLPITWFFGGHDATIFDFPSSPRAEERAGVSVPSVGPTQAVLSTGS